MTGGALVAVVALCLAGSGDAAATDPAHPSARPAPALPTAGLAPTLPSTAAVTSPYRVHLGWDLSITAAALAGTAAIHVAAPSRTRIGAPDEPNALDATVIGNRSRGVAAATDIGIGTMLAAPFLLGAVDALLEEREGAGRAWLEDSLIVAEALSVSLLLNTGTKHIVRRPRPSVHALAVPVTIPIRGEGRVGADEGGSESVPFDDTLSFYSGHSTLAFTAATALSRTWQLRHGPGRSTRIVWASSLAAATLIAAGRAVAGKHFWTDVGTGAVVGFAVGWGVPALHR